jgi:hypothetical protein
MWYITVNKERIVTMLILIGLFGGLVDGPIDSLLDYHAPPVKRFWLFIIPEFIRFTCVGIMIYYGRSRKSNVDRKLCLHPQRLFRAYRLSSASNDFIVLMRLNHTFEENAENY